MKYHIPMIIVFILLTISTLEGQNTPVEKGLEAITGDAIRAQLGFLSSDWMEGREAGEKGEFLASDYIASMLQLYGIKPGGDYINDRLSVTAGENKERTYFQNFVLIRTLPGDEQILKIKSEDNNMIKSVNLTYNVDFVCRPYDQTSETEAPVVFAGYGYIDDSLKYNDFEKLQVRGKYILKLAGFPKFVKSNLEREQAASLRSVLEARYKAMGVIGVLEFDQEITVAGRPERKDFMTMSPSEGKAQQGKPWARYSIPGKQYADNLTKIQVSVRSANEILNGTGINLEAYKAKADRNEKYLIPEMKGKSVYLKSSVKTSQVAVRNIIGIVEGKIRISI
ncbi:MAG: hypothetical protein IPJ37_23085 [Bacteroidales bacterium]|nr:hypothetical protein [Bacteroidales bacterium]